MLNGRVLYGCCLSVFLSSLALIFFQITSSWGIAFNVLFMLIAGVCNCGPDPLLTGSVPAKIGEKENAQAAVSGVVNGKLLLVRFGFCCMWYLIKKNLSNLFFKLIIFCINLLF